MVRIALVGLGFMGKTHLGVYERLAGVEVTALNDVRREALEITSLDSGGNIAASSGAIDLSGVKKYTDYTKMLEEGGFDAVDICLPTYLHAEYSVQALEHGYHCFCEKPLALSARECDRVLDAEAKSGRVFSVGQCLRFWPAYTEAKRIIDGGKYGSAKYAELSRYSPTPRWGWDNWLLDAKRSGGAALDLHVHDVDTVLWFFGKPSSVRSQAVFEKGGGASHISTVYSYDGRAVTSTGGWGFPARFPFNMRALYLLEGAAIEMDFAKNPVLSLWPAEGERQAVALPEGDGYYHELESFARSVEAGKSAGVVSGQSAAEAVRLCLLEVESARTGRELKLP